MYKILHTTEIIRNIVEELNSTYEDIIVVSAFIKLDALKYIDNKLVNYVQDKKLLVRFRLEDILSGATDFELYDYCKMNNWRIFVNFDLHSKIIVFDSKRIILGSANITSMGLGLGLKQNIESAISLDLNNDELVKIKELFLQSVELDDHIFEKMMLQYKKIVQVPSNSDLNINWSDEIMNQLASNINILWTTEMFFSDTFYNIDIHDKELLGITSTIDVLTQIDIIRQQFMVSKPYKWLKSIVEDEMYFGELSLKLHSALIDDPKPYRKDVKKLLSNLLNWIIDLRIEEFTIDRPNHSQRIKYNKIKRSP